LPSAVTAFGKHVSRLNFLRKAVERSASQRLAVLINRFASCFLRHCRADYQGRNDSSEEKLEEFRIYYNENRVHQSLSGSMLIPEQAAHDSGMMPPTDSEIIAPTVPK
jgi:hypothetical protein